MTASGDRGDPPSTDPVSTVSRWVDNNLQLVRGAMSAVVFGSALASVFLLRRAVREAREALTLSTNADVVKLIESMRSSTPVTLTVRVEGVTATGHIRVTHNPWWKRYVRAINLHSIVSMTTCTPLGTFLVSNFECAIEVHAVALSEAVESFRSTDHTLMHGALCTHARNDVVLNIYRAT